MFPGVCARVCVCVSASARHPRASQGGAADRYVVGGESAGVPAGPGPFSDSGFVTVIYWEPDVATVVARAAEGRGQKHLHILALAKDGNFNRGVRGGAFAQTQRRGERARVL